MVVLMFVCSLVRMIVFQRIFDKDLALNDLDRRCTTGYVTTFGGTAISWASKL